MALLPNPMLSQMLRLQQAATEENDPMEDPGGPAQGGPPILQQAQATQTLPTNGFDLATLLQMIFTALQRGAAQPAPAEAPAEEKVPQPEDAPVNPLRQNFLKRLAQEKAASK